MAKRILIFDGHPDPKPHRYVHALAIAYRDGAASVGHQVRMCELARMDVPSLQGNDDFLRGTPADLVQRLQKDLAWCEHLVLLYPLWLGSMPGKLKMLLEQALRPGFAFGPAAGKKGFPPRLLKGRSARIVVTMGMPGFFFRWFYRGHSLKSVKRNILRFVGFAPVRSIVIGNVESPRPGVRERWLERMRQLGQAAR